MKFYNIANHNTEEGTAVIQLMDQIGYNWFTDSGVEATNFINDVRALGELKEVYLEVNSPGGNVHDGVAIANFIKSHDAEWTASIIGQAASIATVISCACDHVEMGVGTNWLVHKPMSVMMGYVNADQARHIAKDLDTIEESIIDFYLARIESAGKTKEELVALMEEDRYMSAAEAVEWGFVDSSLSDMKAVAYGDAKSAFQCAILNAQLEEKETYINELKSRSLEDFLSSVEDEVVMGELKEVAEKYGYDISKTPVIDVEHTIKACSEAGIPELIQKMIDKGLAKEQVDQKIMVAKELKTVCEATGVDYSQVIPLLDEPVKLMSSAIASALASSEVEIDATMSSGVGESPSINVKDIYEKRNQRGN